ncbi:hypothetical protein BESB_080370 [Besnoitia besnoiti]|uniref:Cap-specific mRNA (nucleoside-2'-O-)-methyltransferase 1 n=1 Tax=Besnoitia besnoiti TaxID=94643 RepID=A0A2A9MBX2_BESBE|nr:hypothetical protein BESB_080370 [Besnoitia besnoiti]PFH33821.1 hypothetical protein BESB_080370 [Besnoitia besnoiti]
MEERTPWWEAGQLSDEDEAVPASSSSTASGSLSHAPPSVCAALPENRVAPLHASNSWQGTCCTGGDGPEGTRAAHRSAAAGAQGSCGELSRESWHDAVGAHGTRGSEAFFPAGGGAATHIFSGSSRVSAASLAGGGRSSECLPWPRSGAGGHRSTETPPLGQDEWFAVQNHCATENPGFGPSVDAGAALENAPEALRSRGPTWRHQASTGNPPAFAQIRVVKTWERGDPATQRGARGQLNAARCSGPEVEKFLDGGKAFEGAGHFVSSFSGACENVKRRFSERAANTRGGAMRASEDEGDAARRELMERMLAVQEDDPGMAAGEERRMFLHRLLIQPQVEFFKIQAGTAPLPAWKWQLARDAGEAEERQEEGVHSEDVETERTEFSTEKRATEEGREAEASGGDNVEGELTEEDEHCMPGPRGTDQRRDRERQEPTQQARKGDLQASQGFFPLCECAGSAKAAAACEHEDKEEQRAPRALESKDTGSSKQTSARGACGASYGMFKAAHKKGTKEPEQAAKHITLHAAASTDPRRFLSGAYCDADAVRTLWTKKTRLDSIFDDQMDWLYRAARDFVFPRDGTSKKHLNRAGDKIEEICDALAHHCGLYPGGGAPSDLGPPPDATAPSGASFLGPPAGTGEAVTAPGCGAGHGVMREGGRSAINPGSVLLPDFRHRRHVEILLGFPVSCASNASGDKEGADSGRTVGAGAGGGEEASRESRPVRGGVKRESLQEAGLEEQRRHATGEGANRQGEGGRKRFDLAESRRTGHVSQASGVQAAEHESDSSADAADSHRGAGTGASRGRPAEGATHGEKRRAVQTLRPDARATCQRQKSLTPVEPEDRFRVFVDVCGGPGAWSLFLLGPQQEPADPPGETARAGGPGAPRRTSASLSSARRGLSGRDCSQEGAERAAIDPSPANTNLTTQVAGYDSGPAEAQEAADPPTSEGAIEARSDQEVPRGPARLPPPPVVCGFGMTLWTDAAEAECGQAKTQWYGRLASHPRWKALWGADGTGNIYRANNLAHGKEAIAQWVAGALKQLEEERANCDAAPSATGVASGSAADSRESSREVCEFLKGGENERQDSCGAVCAGQSGISPSSCAGPPETEARQGSLGESLAAALSEAAPDVGGICVEHGTKVFREGKLSTCAVREGRASLVDESDVADFSEGRSSIRPSGRNAPCLPTLARRASDGGGAALGPEKAQEGKQRNGEHPEARGARKIGGEGDASQLEEQAQTACNEMKDGGADAGDHSGVPCVFLVVADGGFHLAVDEKTGRHIENFQELLCARLLLSELLFALLLLQEGGTFLCKIFDTFTHFTASLVYIVARLFKNCVIIKPTGSRAANSERYLVGLRLKSRTSDEFKKLFEAVRSVHNMWEREGNAGDKLAEEEAPESLLPLGVLAADVVFRESLGRACRFLCKKQSLALDLIYRTYMDLKASPSQFSSALKLSSQAIFRTSHLSVAPLRAPQSPRVGAGGSHQKHGGFLRRSSSGNSVYSASSRSSHRRASDASFHEAAHGGSAATDFPPVAAVLSSASFVYDATGTPQYATLQRGGGGANGMSDGGPGDSRGPRPDAPRYPREVSDRLSGAGLVPRVPMLDLVGSWEGRQNSSEATHLLSSEGRRRRSHGAAASGAQPLSARGCRGEASHAAARPSGKGDAKEACSPTEASARAQGGKGGEPRSSGEQEGSETIGQPPPVRKGQGDEARGGSGGVEKVPVKTQEQLYEERMRQLQMQHEQRLVYKASRAGTGRRGRGKAKEPQRKTGGVPIFHAEQVPSILSRRNDPGDEESSGVGARGPRRDGDWRAQEEERGCCAGPRPLSVPSLPGDRPSCALQDGGLGGQLSSKKSHQGRVEAEGGGALHRPRNEETPFPSTRVFSSSSSPSRALSPPVPQKLLARLQGLAHVSPSLATLLSACVAGVASPSWPPQMPPACSQGSSQNLSAALLAALAAPAADSTPVCLAALNCQSANPLGCMPSPEGYLGAEPRGDRENCGSPARGLSSFLASRPPPEMKSVPGGGFEGCAEPAGTASAAAALARQLLLLTQQRQQVVMTEAESDHTGVVPPGLGPPPLSRALGCPIRMVGGLRGGAMGGDDGDDGARRPAPSGGGPETGATEEEARESPPPQRTPSREGVGAGADSSQHLHRLLQHSRRSADRLGGLTVSSPSDAASRVNRSLTQGAPDVPETVAAVSLDSSTQPRAPLSSLTASGGRGGHADAVPETSYSSSIQQLVPPHCAQGALSEDTKDRVDFHGGSSAAHHVTLGSCSGFVMNGASAASPASKAAHTASRLLAQAGSGDLGWLSLRADKTRLLESFLQVQERLQLGTGGSQLSRSTAALPGTGGSSVSASRKGGTGFAEAGAARGEGEGKQQRQQDAVGERVSGREGEACEEKTSFGGARTAWRGGAAGRRHRPGERQEVRGESFPSHASNGGQATEAEVSQGHAGGRPKSGRQGKRRQNGRGRGGRGKRGGLWHLMDDDIMDINTWSL